MPLTEKGTLPVGVEYDGKTHRDFEIREQLTRDTIDVFDDESLVNRAAGNDAFLGLCILSKQIVRIGGIPLEAITPEMLMNMLQDDFTEIQRASKRMEEKRRSFRIEPKTA